MISNGLSPTVPVQLDRGATCAWTSTPSPPSRRLGEADLNGSVFKPENLSLVRYTP